MRSTSRGRSTCSSSRSTRRSRTAARSSSSIPRRSPPTGCPICRRRRRAGSVGEDEYLHPTTMYGCNKLYCEHAGRLLRAPLQAAGRRDRERARRLPLRAVPGLISALTVPSGGTSDYAPEMIHAAAKGEPYACFVRPDTRIPFMAMPDGVEALLTLAAAPRERLQRTAYNVGAFNPSAEEIRDVVAAGVPRREAHLAGRPQAPGDRRLVAGRRRRLRRAPRLGLPAALRLRPRLQRIPHPDDPQALRQFTKSRNPAITRSTMIGGCQS